MADLDDFFAKKDRKKGKSVKKFSTPDEISKKIDDTKQKNDVKIRKERPPGQGQDGEDGGAMPGDEDEWREFEVAKKDYTGLKIQPLTPGEANNQNISSGPTGSESGTPQEQQGRGPWNKGEETPEGNTEEQEEAPATVPVPLRPSAPVASGGYVAPALRNRPPGGLSEPAPRSRHQKTHAPDIHNEEYFPTLGGESVKKATGGAWTEAGAGARTAAREPPARVTLGNRFTSLTHDS